MVSWTALVLRALHPPSATKSLYARKAAAVSSKLEDGNISAAVRILCSDDTPVVFSSDNPPEYNKIRIPQPRDGMPTLWVYEDKMLDAIRSFPAGSAASPDGIRPQHLLELVQSYEAGSRLLNAFANILLAGMPL